MRKAQIWHPPWRKRVSKIENALPMNMSRTFFICFCKKNPAQNLGVLTAERHVNGITQAGRLGNKKRIMK